MKKPLIVNLYAGPGAGKSTAAAWIFACLKMKGVNCELVTEFAKDKTWEQNKTALDNQVYMFGKQFFRITKCADKVDVIITDSPLMLSTIYNTNPILGDEFNKLVYNVSESFTNKNYFIHRVKPYNPVGRSQSESEAKDLDTRIKDMLEAFDLDYTVITGDQDGYDYIVLDILYYIKDYMEAK